MDYCTFVPIVSGWVCIVGYKTFAADIAGMSGVTTFKAGRSGHFICKVMPGCLFQNRVTNGAELWFSAGCRRARSVACCFFALDTVSITMTAFREPLKIHFQKDTWCGIIKKVKRGGQYYEKTGWHV